MREQMIARIWDEEHERSSADAAARIGAARAGLKRRLKSLPDQAVHGLLMVAAVAASATALTLASPAGASAPTSASAAAAAN